MSFIGPATPEIYTLSLHDALPILVGLLDPDGVGAGAHERDRVAPRRITPARRHDVRVRWLARSAAAQRDVGVRSEEHTSELQSRQYLVCRLLLEKKKMYDPFLLLA